MSDVSYLLSSKAVRERSMILYEAALRDELENFRVRDKSLSGAAQYVIEEIRRNYPSLKIPYHSRWRHFEVGGKNRVAEFLQKRERLSVDELGRDKFRLAILSVLLDAGAGTEWKYREKETGESYSRSEGLAVASFRMFEAGAFSDPKSVTVESLSKGFQVGPDNPMTGLAGRVALVKQLLELGDPGLFWDAVRESAVNNSVPAETVLKLVLNRFGSIWPGRISQDGINLGDTWKHKKIRTGGATDDLIPFHKLSQWLTYSLIEPLEEGGIAVRDLDALTGLPEYRNGGFFVDSKVIEIKNPRVLQGIHKVSSEPIIEWRALTVILLDKIAELIRQQLGLTKEQFPLACVLQGGTWSAGRRIARELREDGGSPILVESDGTVF